MSVINFLIENQQFITAFLYVIIAFFIFFYINYLPVFKNYFRKKYGYEVHSEYEVNFTRMLGVFLFGIIPLLTILFIKNKHLYKFGLNFKNIDSKWILILGPILILLTYKNRKTPDNLKNYPQIRNKKWNTRILIISAVGWFLYLLSYEFLFRGVLLYISYYTFGFWPSIIINVSVYSLVHIPKGKKEALGAIPLGIILCLLTLKSNSIFTAFILHLMMALANEWFSLNAHPTINYIHQKPTLK